MQSRCAKAASQRAATTLSSDADRCCQQYPIDVDRIVLYGFSMGGAGSWSIGAHYPDLWAVVQPGAGFAETNAVNLIAAGKCGPPPATHR